MMEYQKISRSLRASSPTKGSRTSRSRKVLEREPGTCELLYHIFRISAPTIVSQLLLQCTYFINTVYAGGLNDHAKLAGVGVGVSILECFTLYILIGLNGAMEIQVAKAYGAEQFILCGVYLNRARIINTIVFVPLMVLMFFSGSILKALD